MNKFDYQLATMSAKKDLKSNWPDIPGNTKKRFLKTYMVDNAAGNTIMKTDDWLLAKQLMPVGGEIRPVLLNENDFVREDAERKERDNWKRY